MKKLLFGVLMMVSTLIFAQSGKVVDKTGEPQAFCKVTAPELNLVTYTDFDSMEVTLKDPEINFPSTLQ
jgi:hypothetical protein